jgi:hypothetical protein
VLAPVNKAAELCVLKKLQTFLDALEKGHLKDLEGNGRNRFEGLKVAQDRVQWLVWVESLCRIARLISGTM